MAYASVTYTSASGTTFALTNSNGDPIPYIRQSDIKVYVNNVLQTVTTDYTFNTAGTAIVLNSPVSGATVLLQRITDITDPTVVYTAGSTLTAQDLNNADNQIRYGLQEFQDSVNAGGGVPDGDKGDITVAGNGTIWTIDSGAVVEAKIASGAVTETKIGTGAVTSAKIADGTIVNADINASAAIAHNKLANITAGSVLLGDASNVPTATALSGDVTVDSSGVTAISSGVIVDADINNSAAIALSKLATGALPTAITVASANIVDGTIVDADISASAEIAVSKLADGTARQLLQTDAAGTGVEWTSNVDIPGTLDVTGAAVFDSTAAVSGDVTIADKIIHAGDTDTAIRFPAADVVAIETSGSERCRVDSSGRLLVGTSTDIAGSTRAVLQGVHPDGPILSLGRNDSTVAENDSIGWINFYGNDSNGTYEECARISCLADGGHDNGDKPSRLVFSTTADGASSPTERMRISQNGIVKITGVPGSLNPDFQLEAPGVIGAGLFIDRTNSRFYAWCGGPQTTGVYLGNAGTSWVSTSDERQKADLQPIVDGLKKIGQLRSVTGRFTTDAADIRRSFLIAQDVQAVLPEAVDKSNPDSLGVSYTDVIPLLVAALKESKERLETLEAQNASQATTIAALEAKVAALEAV